MRNIFKTLGLLIVILLTFSIEASAANRYFKTGATVWNSASSWSATSASGTDNAGVPTASDAANFTANSGSCLINATVNCSGIVISSGYTGVITQGAYTINIGTSGFIQNSGSFLASSSSITINGNFSLMGGTFNGSNSNINITGITNLSAGTFTSTSQTLTLSDKNFTIASGVFNHNNGTIFVDGLASRTYSFNNNTLFNFILTGTNLSNTTITFSTPFTIAGRFTFESGEFNLTSGTITVTGDLRSVNNTQGTMNFTISGTFNQTIDCNGSSGEFGSITINKSGGILNILDTPRFGDDFTYIAGIVNWGLSTPVFGRNGSNTTPTITSNGLIYNNVTIDTNSTDILTLNGDMIINGLFELDTVYTINGSKLILKGDIVCGTSSIRGTASTVINGTGDQSIRGNGTLPGNGTNEIIINKPSGVLILGSNIDFMSDNQRINFVKGEISLNGYNLSVRDSFKVFDKIKLKGNEIVTLGSQLSSSSPYFTLSATCSTVEYVDSSVIAQVSNLSKTYYNLTLGANKRHEFKHFSNYDDSIVIKGLLSANGSSSARTLMRSDSDSSRWRLIIEGTQNLTDKVDVRDCNASFGPPIIAIGSIDSGNNNNWYFTQPTVTNVTSSGLPDGVYMQGQNIYIQVTFSEPVHVTGFPTLLLELGAVDRVATYDGNGSSTNTLYFSYTTMPGDVNPDLDYVSTSSLSLNGGTIKNLSNNINANLTLPAPGSAGSYSFNRNVDIYTFMATPQTVTINEDNNVVINFSSNYRGASAISYQLYSGPSHGNLSYVGPGYRYTPAANYNGADSITFAAVAGSAQSTTAVVSIVVNPVNDTPVAVADSKTTSEDTVASITPVVNDTDIDGDSLSISAVTNGTKGVSSYSGNTITYTPNANANGSDTITYTISDGNGGTATANIAITITAVNDAPVAVTDSITTNEDTLKTFNPTTNDTDAENNTISVTATTNGSKGIVTRSGNNVTYTPNANANGSDTFTYTISDGVGGSNTGTVNVSITPINDSPVAVANSITTNEDTPLTFDPTANDTDVDGNPLTITATTNGTKGIVTRSGNSVTYTPNANVNGSDTFTYTISDGNGGTATGNVTVTITAINDAPVAITDTTTTNEDTAVSLNPTTNDTDAENNTLTITAKTNGSNGSVTYTGNTVTYTPNTNFNGSDSFTYTISDGNGGSAIGTVNVTITAVNDAPVAVTDTTTTNEDTAVSLNPTTNDTDVENNTITISATTNGSNGVVSYSGNIATYTPNANFNGTDSFTYSLSDGNGGTATGTVNVTIIAINDAPVVVTDAITTNEDTAESFNPTTNDTDVENNTLTITANTNGIKGVASFSGNIITYTPNANASGADSFSYTIIDGMGGTGTGTVNVTISPLNDFPNANNDLISTNQNTPISFNPTLNDTDVDGDTLTISGTTNGTLGIVSRIGNMVTYTPNTNAVGSDSFTYTIIDGNSGSATGTVNVTIISINGAPVAVTDSITTNEDTIYSFNPTTNDTDPDSNPLTITATTNGTKGVVSYAGNTVTYTPNLNANGSDTFTYTINDGNGGTAVGTVNVTLTAINDIPIAINDSITVIQNTAYTFNPVVNDSDADGNPLSITAKTDGTKGLVTFTSNSLTYTPNLNATGADSFTYTISDGNGGSATATVSLTIVATGTARYFKTGATSFNNANSWSASGPAGVDNAGIPGATHVAIFEATAGNCTIDATVSILGLAINSGYTGTITQGAFAVTVGATGLSKAGGIWNSSASAITVNGPFNASAGTFNATTGTLTLANAITIAPGTFNPSTGTVAITGATVTLANINFYNLTLNNASQIITLSNNTVVGNTLTVSALATLNGSPLEARGNVVFTDTSWNGSSKVLINGTGTQTNTGTGVCGVPLEINKSAGSFNLGANLTLLGATSDLNLVSGTVNANTFTITIPRNFVKTGGTLNTGTGTFIFNGAATTIIDGNFYNLTLNNSALVATITNNTIVNNTLTLTALATINGSPVEARGNIVFTDTSFNGTSKIIANGTGTQTNTGTGVCGVPLEINKSAGSFNLGANLTLLGTTSDLTLTAGTVNCNTFTVTIPRNLIKTAGTINTGTGTFIFNGTTTAITSGSFYNLTLNNAALVATLTNNTIVNNTLTLTALATINGSPIEAKGNFVFTDTSWNGTSKIIANGTLDQAISGVGTVGDFEINKTSGNLTFNSSVAVSKKWAHIAGNIIWNSNTVTANGAAVNLASGSFYNLTLNNSSLVLTNSANIIVNNTLTLTALATINGSPLEAKANLVFTDTSFNGTSKIIANGIGAQSTSGAGVCGVTLDINKSAGTFTLGANLTLLGTTSDLNLIAGTLNCATFTLTVPRNFTQSGGSFLGGTNTNTINGILTVNAGTYTATSGNTTVPSGNITLAAGTFTHNNGTLLATGSASRTYNFNNNTINHFTISGTTTASILTFSTPVTINGKLIYSAATLNLTSGTITLLGDLSARGLSIGTANYTFSGTNNQTIDCNGTTGNIGSITINKSGGTLNVTNTPIFIKNFTYTAGTVNWGTSIAKFGQVSTTNNPVITSNGLQFGNVEILTGTADTLTLTGDMIVNGTFNMNVANIINGSSFRLRGNITVTDVAQTGTANTIIDGTTDQTITGAGTLPGNGSAETIINKPSGSLTLLSNISFSNLGQDLRVVKGNINLNGFNLTVRDFYRVFDKMTLKGSETITVNLLTTPAVTNPQFTISGTSSTIEYIDSAVVANITKHAKSFYNLNLGAGKTHEVATGAGNGITVNGSLNSNGSAASRSVLRSLANASTTWQLNLSGTSALAEKVDVKNSDASLGVSVSAIGSINSGNNTNWNFSQPPVVLAQIKLEAIKNSPFTFDLASHVSYSVMSELTYELLNPNNIPGLTISSAGVISSSNVGSVVGEKEFTVNIRDSYNRLVPVTLSLFVVEIFLNPNGIVEINNSKITIAASGLGDTPLASLRNKLLSESGHDEEWLDVSFDKSNLLNYYGITDVSDLPTKIMVTITPNEKFQSENLVKVGLGVLNANGVFTRLYETTQKTFTGYYNRFEMTLSSQELNTATTPFTQGLNKVVMFTQLANGMVTYYSGAPVQTAVAPYLRSTVDTSRTYTPVNGSYQYNYILGLANGIFVDDVAPEFDIYETMLGGNKITITGNLIDTIGADDVNATIAVKNASNVYVPLNINEYKVTKSGTGSLFALVIEDKDATTQSISLIPTGSSVRIYLSTKDFLGNLNDTEFIDLNYFPMDKIVDISSLTASSAGPGLASITYQASILDSNYQLDQVKINETIEPNLLTNSINISASEGLNYYRLTVKVKNISDPTIIFEISKTVQYEIMESVLVQAFVVSGNANTNYGKLTTDDVNNRQITFEIANPNNYPITINVSLFNHFTNESTPLNFIEYEKGKYRVTSELDLYLTIYDVKVNVSSTNGLVNKEVTSSFQNGAYVLVASNVFTLSNTTTVSLVGTIPEDTNIFQNGNQISSGSTLSFDETGLNSFSVVNNNGTQFDLPVMVTPSGQLPAVNMDGENETTTNFSTKPLAFNISYPLSPTIEFNKAIIKTTDQYLRGTISSEFQSLMVIRNGQSGAASKEVAAELKVNGNKLFEYSAYLHFLEEGENHLTIKAIRNNTATGQAVIVSKEYTVIFDRKHPTVTFSFGSNYPNGNLPTIFGYKSLYKTLTIGTQGFTQSDYEFQFDITDDYYLGIDEASVIKNLKLQISGNVIDLNKFDFTLSEDKKTLNGKIKSNEKVFVADSENLVLTNAKVEIKDYIGNYSYKYKAFNFERGSKVSVKYINKPLKIYIGATQGFENNKIPFSFGISPSESVGSLGNSIPPIDGTLNTTTGPSPFGPALEIVPGQNISSNIELYQGGAIEQAQLLNNNLNASFSVLTNGNQSQNVYIPTKIFASGSSTIPPEGFFHLWPGEIHRLKSEFVEPNWINYNEDASDDDYPNIEDFGVFLYQISVDVNNFMQKLTDLKNAQIAPSLTFSTKGRQYVDDFVFPPIFETAAIMRQYTPFGYEIEQEEFENPALTYQEAVRRVLESSNSNKSKYSFNLDGVEQSRAFLNNVTLYVKTMGTISGECYDTFQIELLKPSNLVSGNSNKFIPLLQVNRSGEQQATSTFVAEVIPPPPGSVVTHVEFDNGQANQFNLYSDTNIYNEILYVLDAPKPPVNPADSWQVTDRAYIQEGNNNTNQADVEININLNDPLPSPLKIRYYYNIMTPTVVNFDPLVYDFDFSPEYTGFSDWAVATPTTIGHQQPLPSPSLWDGPPPKFTENKLDIYVKGVSLINAEDQYGVEITTPYEGKLPVTFIEPSYFQFNAAVSNIFINEAGGLTFSTNLPEIIHLKDIKDFVKLYLNLNKTTPVNKPVSRGKNRYLLSKIIINGAEFPIYLDVIIGDGDSSTSTSDDFFVESSAVQSTLDLSLLLNTNRKVIEYKLLQFLGKTPTFRQISITANGNEITYNATSSVNSWTTRNIVFITPSYYQFLFSKTHVSADNSDFIVSLPGKNVVIKDLNELKLPVKGAKISKIGGEDVIDLNSDDEYEFNYYENIEPSNIQNLNATIISYDDRLNVLETYISPAFNTYLEYNDSAKLDEFSSNIHKVTPANLTLNKIRFASTLAERNNLPNNLIKLLVKDGGAVVIKIGSQTNIYRVKLKKVFNIDFEAITGITPRVGASSFSGSEGLVIRSGSGSVFAHNRQFTHSQLDMSVSGRATSLSFVRTYRSGVDTRSGLGYGWDHNFNKYFIEDKDGNLDWFQGNGRHDKINKPTGLATDPYILPPGFLVKIVKKEIDKELEHFVVYYSNGSLEEYRQVDDRFKLTKTMDANNNMVSIDWKGNAFKAECDNGKYISFSGSYLTDGIRGVTYVVNKSLKSASYTGTKRAFIFDYNADGMLNFIKSSNDGNLAGTNNDTLLAINYSLDSGKEYQVTSQIANGITHTIDVIAGGGVSETISAVDVLPLTTSYKLMSSDMSQQESRYPSEIRFPGTDAEILTYAEPILDIFQVASVKNRKGVETRTNYRPAVSGDIFSKGLIETVEVKKAANSVSDQDKIDSAVEYTTKTINGNTIYLVFKSTDARLNKTTFDYDDKGNLLKKSVESDSGLITNRFKYDGFGRLQGSVGPNGAASANLYYDKKDTFLTIEATGWLRRTISNGSIRPLTEIDTKEKADAIIDALLAKDKDNIRDDKKLQVSDFAYDKIGNLTTVVDSLGKSTVTEFDTLRRVKYTTGPDFNGHGHTTIEYEYKGTGVANDIDKGWGNWTTCTTSIPYPNITATQNVLNTFWTTKSLIAKREYNQYGWLKKEKAAGEQEKVFVLDNFGRTKKNIIKGTTASPSQVTSFEYDDRANVKETIVGDDDPDTAENESVNNKITFGAEYDSSNNLKATKRNGKVVSSTLYDGLDRAYSASNHLTNTVSKVTFDAGSNVTNAKAGILIDSTNGTMGTPHTDVTMEIDKLGVATHTTDNLRRDENGNLDPAVFAMSYDIFKNEVKQYNPNYPKAGNTAASTGYAKKGKMEKASDILEESAAVVTSSDNLISTTTYPDKTVIIKEFNVDGTLKHVTKDESEVENADKDLIKKRRTRFEYDDSGFLVMDIVQKYAGAKFEDPKVGEIISKNTYVRDGVGRAILITDARGNHTHNEYNDLGQLAFVTTGFGSNNAIVKALKYYPNGKLQSEQQETQKTVYEYNPRGAITQITYYQNFDDELPNNPNGKKEIEKFGYNDKGLLKTKTLRHAVADAAKAVVLTYVYEYEIDANETGQDETDFVAQIKHGNKVLREFGDYRIPEVSFYLNGHPTFSVEHNRFYKNGAIDHSGDVETTYQHNSSWDVVRETTAIYDLNGQAQVREIRHFFDKAGNLKSLKYPTIAKGSLEYSYDKLNRLTNIEDKVNKTSVKSFKYFGLGKVYSSSEGNGKLIQTFAYDKQDWLESIKSGDGVFNAGTFDFKRENNGIKKTVDYMINGIGAKTDSFTYDEHNRLVTADKKEGAISLFSEEFILDKLDNFTSKTLNSQFSNYALKESVRIDKINEDDNLKFEYDTRGNTTKDDKFNYSWDDFDRIKTIENKNQDVEPYASLVNYESLSFTTATENELTFTFDSQAQFTVDTLQIEGLVNNDLIVEYKVLATDANWLTVPANKVFKTLVGPTIVSFGDINVGQVRIREIDEGSGFELNTNSVFQFKNYVYPADVWSKIEYLYDASGRRVQKIVEGSKGYWYLFDGYQMIEERTFTRGNSGTELRRQVVYGTEINEPVYIYDSASNENYYLLKNDQNTVLALYKSSDGAGSAPREQYEYSSYGITNILDENGLVKTINHDANTNTPNTKQVKSDFANPFGYQGMWRDEHTGLYHTHYRLYDPQHVRWLTPDPAGYRDGQNLYRFYAGPNGVDVLGLAEKVDEEKEKAKKAENELLILKYLEYQREMDEKNHFPKPKETPKPIEKSVSQSFIYGFAIQAGKLADNVYYSEGAPIGWERISDPELKEMGLDPTQFYHDKEGKHGFFSALYKNNKGDFVLAFRGTQPLDWRDWAADGLQWSGYAKYSESYKKALANSLAVSEVISKLKGNLIYTGHSLGGGLAACAGLFTKKKTYTFNAAGVNPKTLGLVGIEINDSQYELIDSYVLKNEILDTVQQGSTLTSYIMSDSLGCKYTITSPTLPPNFKIGVGFYLCELYAWRVKLHTMSSVSACYDPEEKAPKTIEPQTPSIKSSLSKGSELR